MSYELLMAGSGNPGAIRFDLRKGKQLPIKPAPANGLCSAYSPVGALFAVGNNAGGSIHVFDGNTGDEITLAGGTVSGQCDAVAFSPDGSLLAVGHSSSPYLTVYNTSDWSKLTIGSLPPGSVKSLAFSPDGSLLAVGHNTTPFLTVYRTSDWSKVTLGANPNATISELSFSPDGSKLAAAGTTSPYLHWYSTTDWVKGSITGGNPGSVQAMAFNIDGSVLFLGQTATPFFAFYDSTFTKLPAISGVAVENTVYGIAFSPDGKLMAAAHGNSSPKYVTLFDTEDWTKIDNPFAVATTGNPGYDVAFYASPARTVTGNVRDFDGDLVQRRIRAYDRRDGSICGETLSDPTTGEYELRLHEGDIEYDIQFMALDSDPLNDLFYARVTSGEP